MGGILAVGGGSKNPPRLVRIDLGSAARGGPVIALVGKGITFDTGGISIKPAAQMDEMKWDKMGACAVLGDPRGRQPARPAGPPARLPAARREHAGRRRLPARRHRALRQRQDGRDPQHRRRRPHGPGRRARLGGERQARTRMVEYSTLTGACVVALGPTGAGLFSPSDDLARGPARRRGRRRRAALAAAALARVPRGDEGQPLRPQEPRRTLGRCLHRRGLPVAVRRRGRASGRISTSPVRPTSAATAAASAAPPATRSR